MNDDDLPSPPAREAGKWLDLSKLKEGPGEGTAEPAPGPRRRSSQPHHPPYAELHAASAFSFLDGASLPEDLVEQAAALELPAMALVDASGVYGAPRFYQAAKQAGIKALVGAEVALEDEPSLYQKRARFGPLGLVPDPKTADQTRTVDAQARLTLLVANRAGYRNLCRLLTAAARGRAKGEARVSWDLLAEHAAGLHCLTGGEEGPLARELAEGGIDPAQRLLERLSGLFKGRLHVELQRHRLREEEHRNQALVDLARRLRLPLLATNGVRYARPEDKPLHDVMTAIRHHTTLDAAGRVLAAHRERHLKSAGEMARLFSDLPQALAASGELAVSLDFTLADLGYRFPEYPLPPGETPSSFLRHITWNGARARFRPLTAKAQAQIQKELDLIEKLDLAGYFLIVWDVVQFCQREGILAQGRGSAANSAVCYALSITAVDPVKMELLFERFLSEERGEWPDIDLDLPSGDQRERVIQYVYQRYGPHGAAMTATVITYRDRSATREVAKVFGYSEEQVDKLARQLGTWSYDVSQGDDKSFARELAAAGFDPEDLRARHFSELWRRIHNMPRHIGQHTGGMVIAAGRLDEVVPLEPASMPGRVVIQWDKDDCADLGIIKVDLLGLGMLAALEEMVPTIQTREGVHVDLAHLPPDDPKVYKMLQEADTVGVFQVESRAQMASLPRNHPTRFYDIVIQVGIIRPGPIVGNLANPYFERRNGRQPVVYPHPSLKPILERTLGVPIFQEQLLRVAMVAAGFTGGEAEELRRAMGSKRSVEKMNAIVEKLRRGMTERGIVGKPQDEIVQGITSFALYGFPESHAASFALIAYASAYLKAHHPTAFYLGILNAWPMGFYHPATLVKDAQRHGVEIRPVDVQTSGVLCRWEDRPLREGERDPRTGTLPPAGAIRLGFKFVKGLRGRAGLSIETEQAKAPFADAEDLARRCDLHEDELQSLASVGALASFGLTRRAALWQVARLGKPAGPLLDRLPDPEPSPLPEMTAVEETQADYGGVQLTLGPHPLTYMRSLLAKKGVTPAAGLDALPNGAKVRTAGSVIVRQRPGTAKGLLFLTLEDETGMSQAVVPPDLLQQHRKLIVGSPGLVVEGVLQKRDGTISVKGEKFWSLKELVAVPSHDFR
ncbi:MAG TPA: error-prone DNA polymerase [Thermoanaerobaculia bacterium]|nr:error-prone DNA polymerase [Thermoanaerobaculia bacterium]